MSNLRDSFNLACRKCGQDEHFDIIITTLARLSADGSDPQGEHEWNDESYCQCPHCRTDGTVADFTTKNGNGPS